MIAMKVSAWVNNISSMCVIVTTYNNIFFLQAVIFITYVYGNLQAVIFTTYVFRNILIYWGIMSLLRGGYMLVFTEVYYGIVELFLLIT